MPQAEKEKPNVKRDSNKFSFPSPPPLYGQFTHHQLERRIILHLLTINHFWLSRTTPYPPLTYPWQLYVEDQEERCTREWRTTLVEEKILILSPRLKRKNPEEIFRSKQGNKSTFEMRCWLSEAEFQCETCEVVSTHVMLASFDITNNAVKSQV